MTASLHLAAGAIAGIAIQKQLSSNTGLSERIFWAFVAGILSHILLDTIPHQEYSLKGFSLWAVILAETGLMFVLIFPSARSPAVGIIMFSAMIGGALPDLLKLLYVYFIKWEWLVGLSTAMHLKIHGVIPLGFKISFWWQSLVTAVLVLFVRSKSV